MRIPFLTRTLACTLICAAVLVCGGLLALGAHPARAQSAATTGVIRGAVHNASGEPVADASVIIHHLDTGLRTVVETNASGVFARALLPRGAYTILVVSETNLGEIRREGLSLHTGETLVLDLSFAVVDLEEITVTAEDAPLLDPEDATRSQRLSEDIVDGLPNNGRNLLDLTLLTPGVAIGQGPDGDVLNIGGQRGVFNNFMVDGADFNNPFFGEQRGGQRPAFTFNQDAVEEMVVVSQGAPAEFGRSAGGFIHVVTRSGTNDFKGSAHYFGQWDAIAAEYRPERGGGKPSFGRNQFGFTLGGPIVRDRAFFFVAYDQQAASETKQTNRAVQNPAEMHKLENFLRARWPDRFENEFGPITRSDDARALTAKLDVHLNTQNQASVKYNYAWSEQVNGTFDVDAWGRSANGIEQDYSHAVNMSLRSLLGNAAFNEFRGQWAVEHRPRRYRGPILPGAEPPATPQFDDIGGRPFPDVGMDFADGFRIGLPYFLPVHPSKDHRLQLVNNVSFLAGDHLFKTGAEYNYTRVTQQFIGFANGRYLFNSVDGFIGFVEQGNRYVTCSDGSGSADGICPEGTSIAGPVLLYMQSATVPGVPPENLGIQTLRAHELALFVQDTWKVGTDLILHLGVRWEGVWHPDVFVAPENTFYAPYLSDPRFPSDGTIPDDLDNIQPRLGLTWNIGGKNATTVRANAGAYYARIPGLVFASPRSTNGAYQQILFRSSADAPALGPVPPIDALIDGSSTTPFLPDIHVVGRNLELPRTWSFSAGVDRALGDGLAANLSWQHARTDRLFRFVDRNAAALGAPFGVGTHPGGGGIATLYTSESSARSRYHGITAGARGRDAFDGLLDFEASYTLSFDRSDDDNERDPFTFTYADPRNLTPEYGWSDRDRRHRFTGYFAFSLPGEIAFSNIFRYLSASPVSERCDRRGVRADTPADRICADGSILRRNTLRRNNAFFTWDMRLSRTFGARARIEVMVDFFNLTNADNFLDTALGSLLFNFDGAIRSGLGNTRRAQVGAKVRF